MSYKKLTPNIEKKPSSLRYFQEGVSTIDMEGWKLEIFGKVAQPVEYSYEDITNFTSSLHHRRTVCVCLWSIRRYWKGVLLRDVLDRAGVDCENPSLYLKQYSHGTDKGIYDSTIHIVSAVKRNAILAHSVDEQILSLENGFPLRLIDFGLYQYKCVKALARLEVTTVNKLGYWEALAGYSLDGVVESKKYYAVDLQKKFYFSKQGEVQETDIV